MSFWTELFSFYLHNERHRFKELDRSSIFGAIFVVLLFTIIFNSITDTSVMERKANGSFNGEDSNVWVSAAIIVLIAPLIEELAFRFFIGRFHMPKFLLSICLIFAYVVLTIITALGQELNYLLSYFLLVGSATVLFVIGYSLNNLLSRIEGFWNNHILLVIFISSVIFSFTHMAMQGYQGGILSQILFLVPLMVFSLVSAFMRIQFGFGYSVFFHSAMNLPALLKLMILS